MIHKIIYIYITIYNEKYHGIFIYIYIYTISLCLFFSNTSAADIFAAQSHGPMGFFVFEVPLYQIYKEPVVFYDAGK